MKSDEEFTQEVNQFSDSIIESMMNPITTIYIDSDFLYDYRLGALLLLIKGQEDYQYILDHLSYYEKNPTMKITNVFPDLKLTEEDVDLVENDIARRVHIQVVAPKTELLDGLTEFVAAVNTYNVSQAEAAKLTLIINCRRHDMQKSIWRDLVAYVRGFDPSVRMIKTNYYRWDEVPEDTIKDAGMLLVYDMSDFVKSKPVMSKMSTMSLNNKILIGYPQIEKDRDSEEETIEALRNFHSVMDVMFGKFIYIQKSISRSK